MKIPLAWLQLTHEKIRLLVALAGIGFADMLMFMQLGFRQALFQSNVTLHESLQGDVFLISPQSDALISLKTFSRRRLYESLAVEGVADAAPLYVGFAFWKNPVERTTRKLMVLGVNPADDLFNLPRLQENIDQIKLQDVVLYDDQSRPEYGPVAEQVILGKTVETELESRNIRVGGLFSLGASFAADGNVITSDVNFVRIFSGREPGLIDIGVLQLEPTADLDAVLASLKAKLPKDVLVLSKAEFIQYEKDYWSTSTPIGFIFALGTGMGFIVGTVIVYQILYTDVADHLPEYATLKALGYRDIYFVKVVFQEAVLLAAVGYIPGFLVASGLYVLTAGATNLPIAMTISRAVTVLILTIVMCCFSGGVAVRKLRAADPADIF
ncbi:MAG: ABC transporter permease DevC [Cyanophyceae cyanobacterium]